MERLKRVNKELSALKKELWRLWAQRETSDKEVLRLAEKIDHLLNQYDYFLRKSKDRYEGIDG